MTKFISAIYHSDILTVEYVADSGDHLLRSGGTIAWRFNNPGLSHGELEATTVLAVMHAELRILVCLTRTGCLILFPQQHQRHTFALELLMHIGAIRHSMPTD